MNKNKQSDIVSRLFLLLTLLTHLFLSSLLGLVPVFASDADGQVALSVIPSATTIKEGEQVELQVDMTLSGDTPPETWSETTQLEITLPAGSVPLEEEGNPQARFALYRPVTELGLELGENEQVFPNFQPKSRKLIYEIPRLELGREYRVRLPIKVLENRFTDPSQVSVSARLLSGETVLADSKEVDLTIQPQHQRVAEHQTGSAFRTTGSATRTLRIKIVDGRDNAIPLNGIKIERFNSGSYLGPVENRDTNASGIVEFTNLPADGPYYFHQKIPKKGYLHDVSGYRVAIDASGSVTVDAPNIISASAPRQSNLVSASYNPATNVVEVTLKNHPFRLLKVDKKNPTVGIQGATFELYNASQQKITDGTSNRQGIVEFGRAINSEDGTYYIKETRAPSTYKLDSTFYKVIVSKTGEFTIEDTSGVVTAIPDVEAGIRVINTRDVTSRIKFVKVDDTTNQTVNGARFQLVDATGRDIPGQAANLTQNGSYTFSDYVLEPGKSYAFREVTAPDGYQANAKIYHFQVDWDGEFQFQNGDDQITVDQGRITSPVRTVTVTMKNARIPYSHLKIKKIDALTGRELSGSRFEVTDQQGRRLSGQVANVTNSFEFPANLEVGQTYGFREISPPSGYALRNKLYLFTVKEDGSFELANGDDYITISDAGSRDPTTKLRVVEVSMKNFKPSEFPKTGGWGAVPYLLLGAFLILISLMSGKPRQSIH